MSQKLFEQSILSSTLFSSTDPTVDGFAYQMGTELTSILDAVAPLKTGHRTGPRKAKKWLSPEVVDAKKQRRRLERRWKASNTEPDRLAYRAACSSANKLITTSFAAVNRERINEASKPQTSLDNHQIHTSFIPSQRTTFTSHITGKFSGFLLSPEDFFPQRFDSLKITWYSYTFWFWSASQWWSRYFQTSPPSPRPKYLNYSLFNVKQIITAWLHSDIIIIIIIIIKLGFLKIVTKAASSSQTSTMQK